MDPFLNPMLRWLLAPEGDGGGQGAGGSGLPPQSIQVPAGGTTPGQQPPSSAPAGQQPNQGTPPQQQPPADDAPVTRAQLNELLLAHGRQVQDATFAALRRGGRLDGAGAGDSGNARRQTPAAGQPTGEDAIMERFERRSNMDRAIAAQGRNVTEAGRRRMVEQLDRDSPDDVAAWVNQYYVDLGHAPAPPAGAASGGSSPPATNTPASNPQRPPVTNVPAAAGSAPSSIRNPYELTQDDVNTMVRAHGWHKTGTQIMDSIRQAPPLRLQVRRR